MITELRRASLIILSAFFVISMANSQQDPGPGVGDRAPDFTLPYATRDTIDFKGLTLSEHIGSKYIILAFYPADWSSGCTKEVCTIRDNFSALEELDAVVFGISGDYVFSHHEWAKYHDLPFTLLSDHSHEVASLYDSYDERWGYNKRTVFVIDTDGTIAYVDMEYDVSNTEDFRLLQSTIATLN